MASAGSRSDGACVALLLLVACPMLRYSAYSVSSQERVRRATRVAMSSGVRGSMARRARSTNSEARQRACAHKHTTTTQIQTNKHTHPACAILNLLVQSSPRTAAGRCMPCSRCVWCIMFAVRLGLAQLPEQEQDESHTHVHTHTKHTYMQHTPE